MSLSHCPPWGSQQLDLSLPGLALRVSDLSAGQLTALQADYAAFCAPTPNDNTDCLHLSARCFGEFEPPPTASLTRDGQYAPLLLRHATGSGFDLTGMNFTASLYPGLEQSGFVGVTTEGDLALPNVFENILRVLIAHRALHLGGAVLHSAGLVQDKRAYIFCGRSNAGKTTLSRKAHSDGLDILSDDINLLLPAGDNYHAHAVPFTGEFGRTLERPLAGSFPVAAIVLLHQGEHTDVRQVSPASATASLLAGCPFVNVGAGQTDTLMDTVCTLIEQVPILELTSARDDSIGAIMPLISRELAQMPGNRQVQAL